jgi:hypothetical protein
LELILFLRQNANADAAPWWYLGDALRLGDEVRVWENKLADRFWAPAQLPA